MSAYDIVRIHSLTIYRDLIEFNTVGDTKAPLLCCFLFVSKLESGDITTTWQCIKSQAFCNLEFRPLLQNSFQSFHIDLRDTSGERIRFVSVGIAQFVLMFGKVPIFHFYRKN